MPNKQPKIRINMNYCEPEYLEIQPLNNEAIGMLSALTDKTVLHGGDNIILNLLGKQNRIEALNTLSVIQSFKPKYKYDRYTGDRISNLYLDVLEEAPKGQPIQVAINNPVEIRGVIEYKEAVGLIRRSECMSLGLHVGPNETRLWRN